jgi:hypothetical protein
VLLQISAANPATQVSGQGGDDVVEWLRHRLERIVRSEDDVIVSEDVDRCVQRFTVVGEGVTPQLAGQPAREFGRIGGYAADRRALVESSDHCRERAATVRQADSHLRPACECAARDQCRSCQRRLDRHAGTKAQSHVDHPVREILVRWMDQDQRVEFMCDREEPVQAGVGKLRLPDPRANLDTEKPGAAHALAHLVDGSVGVLQGDGPERSETCWVLECDSVEELVLCCS